MAPYFIYLHFPNLIMECISTISFRIWAPPEYKKGLGSRAPGHWFLDFTFPLKSLFLSKTWCNDVRETLGGHVVAEGLTGRIS